MVWLYEPKVSRQDKSMLHGYRYLYSKMRIEDVYKNITINVQERFITSRREEKGKLTELTKEELGGKIMIKFVRLCQKRIFT